MLLVVVVLDAIWLGVVAKDLYKREMGSLMTDSVRIVPVAVFYLLYPLALVYLALFAAPAGWAEALLRSAVLGLAAYGAYDLTNMAIVRGWPSVSDRLGLGRIVAIVAGAAGYGARGRATDAARSGAPGTLALPRRPLGRMPSPGAARRRLRPRTRRLDAADGARRIGVPDADAAPGPQRAPVPARRRRIRLPVGAPDGGVPLRRPPWRQAASWLPAPSAARPSQERSDGDDDETRAHGPVPRPRQRRARLPVDLGPRLHAATTSTCVMSDDTRKRHFGGSAAGRETELGNKAAEGAGIGGAIGGSLGAIAAAIAAVGTTIALPGLGLVIAGPLAAAIAGAGAGAATGGIVGALIGWGIPEERVKEYDAGHPRRRHPDGRAAAERGRRELLRELLEEQPRRARLPLSPGRASASAG